MGKDQDCNKCADCGGPTLVFENKTDDWLCLPCMNKRVGEYVDQAGEEVVTLRDRFAIAALPLYYHASNLTQATITKLCYELADEMMKARMRNGQS